MPHCSHFVENASKTKGNIVYHVENAVENAYKTRVKR